MNELVCKCGASLVGTNRQVIKWNMNHDGFCPAATPQRTAS